MIKNFTVDKLKVCAFETRAEMGDAAAKAVHDKIMELLETKETINMLFAAAPSQNDVLASLVACKDIPWERINALHMDEYVNLAADAPQGFGNFLRNAIFGKVNFRTVSYLNGNAEDIEAECARYTALLEKYPLDIACIGIGENGHIAFNDPHVADFNDPKTVKCVDLDEKCRQQQVNDGCFAHIDLVPKNALTLTVPTIFNADYIACIVPAITKANAVNTTINGEIGEYCPATILRRHDNVTLYLDKDSSSRI